MDRKIIVILDVVRYDEFKAAIWPEVGGTLSKAQALGDNTRDVVDAIGEIIKEYPGKVIQKTWNWVIKVVGNIGTLDYKFMYPLKDDLNGCLTAAEKLKDGELLIIHDFWIHNHFQDLPGKEKDLTLENLFPLYRSYVGRMRRFAPILKDFIEKTDPVPLWIIADHGQAFGEIPGSYHHGHRARPNGARDPGVMGVFILDARGENKLDPEPGSIADLFRGKESQ